MVVPRKPSAVNDAAPFMPAETEAVGVPLLTFKIANFADAVEVPPTKRSKVLLNGETVPLLSCQ